MSQPTADQPQPPEPPAADDPSDHPPTDPPAPVAERPPAQSDPVPPSDHGSDQPTTAPVEGSSPAPPGGGPPDGHTGAGESPAPGAPSDGDAPADQPAPGAPAGGEPPTEPSPDAQSAPPDAERGKVRSKGKAKAKKGGGPSEIRPQDVVARIGDTNERALAYVLEPDAQLSRLPRRVRDTLITDLPPVTAAALLGPAALARHFVASAASGRYRDLFALWELFRQRPVDCKPVLAERPQALDRARATLRTAVRLGLTGRADRVAADVEVAQGLVWQWLRDALLEVLPAVGRRPAVASALLRRDPDLEVPLPDPPDEGWVAEAAAARAAGPLAPRVEEVLGAHADRLPATVATLALAHQHYPDRVGTLVERVDLDGPEVGSVLAWARDHGYGGRLRERAQQRLEERARQDRADALAGWQTWRERGVELDLPEPLLARSLEGLDLGRPETAVLLARLVADGAELDPQVELDQLAVRNRQLAEKAYEAFVCARLEVTLPKPLAQNPIVRDGTRCPHCLAWTWVRPGHERRCPQRPVESGPAPAGGGPDASANGAPAGPGGGGPTAPQPTGPGSRLSG